MSYVDTGLTASTPYYYQVVATNNAGDSNASNVAGVTTFPTYAENGLVAFYPLEQVESDTTSDVTGNGHDGSIPSGEGYIAQDGGYVNNASMPTAPGRPFHASSCRMIPRCALRRARALPSRRGCSRMPRAAPNKP